MYLCIRVFDSALTVKPFWVYAGEITMDMQIQVEPAVKATLRLGSQTHTIEASKGGILSEQLVFVKGESMSLLKDFITKNNVPIDVPDADEISSEDDVNDDGVGLTVKSKKIRTWMKWLNEIDVMVLFVFVFPS